TDIWILKVRCRCCHRGGAMERNPGSRTDGWIESRSEAPVVSSVDGTTHLAHFSRQVVCCQGTHAPVCFDFTAFSLLILHHNVRHSSTACERQKQPSTSQEQCTE